MGKYLTREKLLGVKNHKHFPLAIVVIVVFLILDLAFLNVKILSSGNPNLAIFQTKTAQVSKTQNVSTQSADTCGDTCMAEINKAVSASVSVEKNTAVSQASYTQAAAAGQEYFIPLGSGVISSPTLTTINGMQATVDGGAYGSNYTATFEISVSIPTGNETANFQLYDATQNHPVWNSNVTFNSGGTPALLTAQITLDPGMNTYVVQGSTQLTYPAYITQARIHIITQ